MKKKLIVAFVVFTAIGVGLFYLLTRGNVGVKYNTVEVTKGEVGKFVEDVGRISSKNIRRYYGNGVSKVEELALGLGDHVKKGQLIIRYEDKLDVEIQKVEKQIEALKATYNDVLSGSKVESISNARIEVSRIKSLLDVATNNKTRTEELYNSGSVPLVDLEQATNAVSQLESSLKVAQNNYSQLTKGVSKNIKAKYEAEIDILIITLNSLEDSRENYKVYADVDGIVTDINTFVGDIPSPANMILEIQDPTKKVILVDFMAEDAIGIKKGLHAKIDDSNLDISIDDLKVDLVYPKAFVTLSELGVRENRQTIEIGLPKSADSLPYGLELNTKVMIEDTREALLVPIGAVIDKNSKEYVNVLEDGKPVEREITTGIKLKDSIEVKEGLDEGDLVILNYQEE